VGSEQGEKKMRAAISTAAILSLVAGTAFAQIEQPSELGSARSPPIQSEPAAPPVSASPETAPPASASPESAPPASPESLESAPMLTEDQAKAKLESEGFMDVSGLRKDEMGLWTASAMKEGKPVQLSLDDQGHIMILN
jgi:hypothetical protein